MSSNARRLSVAFDESKIDAIFAELNQCYLPGAAVGIAIGGKPVYRKGFGLANMEMPLLLKPSMRLRIGSTTKHFTCLAYLLLCEAGEAGIDDPLGKHLPELHPVTHKVTMRQLMGNLSGLRDSMAIRGVFGGHAGAGLRQVPTTEILALYRTIDDVNIAPGLNWIYNNAGFGLVSAVIERITGQTFAQVMWESVFQPLGMYDSLVRHWDNDFVSNCAAGHDIVCEDTWNKARFGFSYEGAGAIVSTVDDMLLWLANMDAHEVGDASTWEVMRTPQRLANGISSRYGLGLWIEPYRGVQTIHHGGGYVGFKTQMLKVPAVGLDVVVMGNRDDLPVDSLVEKIIDACI